MHGWRCTKSPSTAMDTALWSILFNNATQQTAIRWAPRVVTHSQTCRNPLKSWSDTVSRSSIIKVLFEYVFGIDFLLHYTVYCKLYGLDV